MGDDNRSLSRGGKAGDMGGAGPNEESRQLQPCVRHIGTALASIILCCVCICIYHSLLCLYLHPSFFIVLILICYWVDQQLFFLEGVIRIINKAKGRVWATKLCIRCCNEPRTLPPPQRTHFGTIVWLLHWLTQKAEVSENPHTSLFGRNRGWQP